MEPSQYHLPSESAMQSIMDDLKNALKNLPKTQRELMSLTAEAWSEDGLVRAEVGPRGQLIDLEIDPRVFRRPDSEALRDSIMEAVSTAIRGIGERSQEILSGQMPADVAEWRAQFRPGVGDPMADMFRSDAEIMAERRRTDG